MPNRTQINYDVKAGEKEARALSRGGSEFDAAADLARPSAHEKDKQANGKCDDGDQEDPASHRMMRAFMFAKRVLVRRVIEHDPPPAQQAHVR
jgi:hypothetical protein